MLVLLLRLGVLGWSCSNSCRAYYTLEASGVTNTPVPHIYRLQDQIPEIRITPRGMIWLIIYGLCIWLYTTDEPFEPRLPPTSWVRALRVVPRRRRLPVASGRAAGAVPTPHLQDDSGSGPREA